MPRTTKTEATPSASEQPAEQQDVIAPEQTAEAPADAPAGDETAPTSEAPAPESQQADGAEQEPEAPAASEAQQEPVAQASEQPAEATSSAEPTPVRVGHVDGMIHRVPIGNVLALLPLWEDRIAALRISPAIASLQQQMRVTEGRCAPIILTMSEDDDEPHLFSGIEAVAAAINLGLEQIYVVTVASGETGQLQSILADAQRQKEGPLIPPVSPA
jgi:hypothetical protein